MVLGPSARLLEPQSAGLGAKLEACCGLVGTFWGLSGHFEVFEVDFQVAKL